MILWCPAEGIWSLMDEPLEHFTTSPSEATQALSAEGAGDPALLLYRSGSWADPVYINLGERPIIDVSNVDHAGLRI